jgi:hypothetical protein
MLALLPMLCSAFNFYGSTRPLNYFDPLGFSEKAPETEKARLRECELKHGRWAMIACLSIPLLESQSHQPAIHEFDKLPANIQLIIVGLITMGEFQTMIRGWKNPFTRSTNVFKLRDDYQPGDIGYNIWQKWTNATFEINGEKELNNGRLAMIAATGMIAQELNTNQPLF